VSDIPVVGIFPSETASGAILMWVAWGKA